MEDRKNPKTGIRERIAARKAARAEGERIEKANDLFASRVDRLSELEDERARRDGDKPLDARSAAFEGQMANANDPKRGIGPVPVADPHDERIEEEVVERLALLGETIESVEHGLTDEQIESVKADVEDSIGNTGLTPAEFSDYMSEQAEAEMDDLKRTMRRFNKSKNGANSVGTGTVSRVGQIDSDEQVMDRGAQDRRSNVMYMMWMLSDGFGWSWQNIPQGTTFWEFTEYVGARALLRLGSTVKYGMDVLKEVYDGYVDGEELRTMCAEGWLYRPANQELIAELYSRVDGAFPAIKALTDAYSAKVKLEWTANGIFGNDTPLPSDPFGLGYIAIYDRAEAKVDQAAKFYLDHVHSVTGINKDSVSAMFGIWRDTLEERLAEIETLKRDEGVSAEEQLRETYDRVPWAS